MRPQLLQTRLRSPVPVHPLLAASLLAALLPLAGAAEPSPGAQVQAAGQLAWATTPYVPPRPNENMDFRLSFLGLPLGKARLFTGAVDGNVVPVILQAQTASLAAIVSLKQQLASYIDSANGLPRSDRLDALEGTYRHTDTIQFNREENKAVVRERGKRDETWTLEVPAGTLDFISLVYRLRHLPLDPGTKYEFNVLTGRLLKTVVVEVLGREKIDTGIGKLEAVKVLVPTGFAGKFEEKNPSYVWFSDDDRRLVARITTNFAIGHATATLEAYSPGALQAETGPSALRGKAP